MAFVAVELADGVFQAMPLQVDLRFELHTACSTLKLRSVLRPTVAIESVLLIKFLGAFVAAEFGGWCRRSRVQVYLQVDGNYTIVGV